MTRLNWASISKEVGWEEVAVEWPTEKRLEELMDGAYSADRGALVSLLRYHRFLKVESEEQLRLIDRLVGILFPCKRMFCE